MSSQSNDPLFFFAVFAFIVGVLSFSSHPAFRSFPVFIESAFTELARMLPSLP